MEHTPDAAGPTLPPGVYEQLRAIAHVRMAKERPGHTLQATALVHEALMRLSDGGEVGGATGLDRPAFFRIAAETMRRILIDHARRRATDKRGGVGADARRVSLEAIDQPTSAEQTVDVLALDEAISRLHQQSPDAAEVVRLRFYGGLTVDETAETMRTSPRSVDRLWAFARASLWQALH